MMELVDATMSWLQEHPIFVVVLAWFLYQRYKSKQPFPKVEGSKVLELSSLQEFDGLLNNNKLIVVDYFASWCPPCRTAAPVYGEMSKVFEESKVVFTKVNVDVATDIAKKHEISAMPTFKIFSSSGELVSSLQGWNESKLRSNLEDAMKSS